MTGGPKQAGCACNNEKAPLSLPLLLHAHPVQIPLSKDAVAPQVQSTGHSNSVLSLARPGLRTATALTVHAKSCARVSLLGPHSTALLPAYLPPRSGLEILVRALDG